MNKLFNELCFYFWNLPPDVQKEILDILTPDQQQEFLKAAGFMRIITDKEYHDKIMCYTMKVYLEALANE